MYLTEWCLNVPGVTKAKPTGRRKGSFSLLPSWLPVPHFFAPPPNACSVSSVSQLLATCAAFTGPWKPLLSCQSVHYACGQPLKYLLKGAPSLCPLLASIDHRVNNLYRIQSCNSECEVQEEIWRILPRYKTISNISI